MLSITLHNKTHLFPILFMSMDVLNVCMSVHQMHLVPERPGEFADCCELPCECWELNPDLLEERTVFLADKSSFHAPELTIL